MLWFLAETARDSPWVPILTASNLFRRSARDRNLEKCNGTIISINLRSKVSGKFTAWRGKEDYFTCKNTRKNSIIAQKVETILFLQAKILDVPKVRQLSKARDKLRSKLSLSFKNHTFLYYIFYKWILYHLSDQNDAV